MLIAPQAKDPIVLSYLAFRKAVGGIALGLPFALAIPVAVQCHELKNSISSYYYTGTQILFIGSLCAISVFLLSARGYDRKDEIAGMFSAMCALGVAFFPTTPDWCKECTATTHYTFAALLFSTLAYFCLVLFKMTAADRVLTPEKRQRNLVYTVCGLVIIASMVSIGVTKIFHLQYSIWKFPPNFFFESTALIAFGIAWLVKGEAFLKDA